MPTRGDLPLGVQHTTRRQEDILALVACGYSDKQVAVRLGVSRHTVRTHLDRLFAVSGIHNRTGLVAAWLLSPERGTTSPS